MKEEKQKRVIKRYSNRKLYDTRDSCYVILEDIADLIRQGDEITVIDNRTSEDITSVTLAQIILEEEKKKKETLPITTFINLIRSGSETIKTFVQKSLGEGVKEISSVKDEVRDNLEKWVRHNVPTVQAEVKRLKEKLDKIEKQLSHQKKPKKKTR